MSTSMRPAGRSDSFRPARRCERPGEEPFDALLAEVADTANLAAVPDDPRLREAREARAAAAAAAAMTDAQAGAG